LIWWTTQNSADVEVKRMRENDRMRDQKNDFEKMIPQTFCQPRNPKTPGLLNDKNKKREALFAAAAVDSDETERTFSPNNQPSKFEPEHSFFTNSNSKTSIPIKVSLTNNIEL
jgi:hypothetical protein